MIARNVKGCSWIFNYDDLRFEPYAEDRDVDELMEHTSNGETIVYWAAADNTLHLIEDGKVTPWPDDEVLDIGGWTFHQYEFEPYWRV